VMMDQMEWNGMEWNGLGRTQDSAGERIQLMQTGVVQSQSIK